MKFLAFGLVAVAAVHSVAATSAVAVVTIPDIQTIETRLCPVGGAKALRLGVTEADQDPALRRAFSGRAAPIAPFTEAHAIYTHWSDKLTAVEFSGASPDGDDNAAFEDGMVKVLDAGGWTVSLRKVPILTPMGVGAYEKVLVTADGPRLMMLQFDASGAVALRCGDFELLRLSEDEQLGWLAPGSPRPVMSASPAGSLGILRPEDCAKPEIRNNLDQVLDEGAHPEINGEFDQAVALDRYQTRLKTWLRWKIVASGKGNGNALWKIEEQTAPVSGAQLEKDFNALLAPIAAYGQVGNTDDAEAKCRVAAGVMLAESKRAATDAARLAKINAALEAEGKRLGVNLD